MFDVLEHEYGSDFMRQAARAGLISPENIDGADRDCTVGEAYRMLVRLFELKPEVPLTPGVNRNSLK